MTLKTVLLLALLAAPGVATAAQQSKPPAPPARPALMCTKVAESTIGADKICMYNCAGSQKAVTIKAGQPCAPTVPR